jgi:S1-C subfamily serine protease
MDETRLRSLLDRAVADEPPLGPVAEKALRAGIKVRRRRILAAAGILAAIALIAAAIPVVARPLGAQPITRQHPPRMTGLNRPANVPPPNKSVLRWSAVTKDRASIVQIRGETITPSCSRILGSSGFVISPQHVLTNAFAVAGMTRLHVYYGADNVLPANVVLFDSNTDVAILYVPGLGAPPLRFAGQASRGSDAVVAGRRPDGKFLAVAARVGSRWFATTPNIYRTGRVTRAIYTVRATVKMGIVAGPLLAKNGKTYGVIFAGPISAPDTIYALTAGAVEPDLRAGAQATVSVSTRGCTPIPPGARRRITRGPP